MSDPTPAPKNTEEPSARVRALRTRLSSARSALTSSHRATTEHLHKYPKSIQPIESMMGIKEHPETTARLMAENEVNQQAYANAFEEYVQAVHEESMRLGEENIKESQRLARIGTVATWVMAALTVFIAFAAMAQIYYLSKQTSQPPAAPNITVYVTASPAPGSPPVK